MVDATDLKSVSRKGVWVQVPPELQTINKRRGGRVVDCAGLENRSPRKGAGGSNPSLSAVALLLHPGQYKK